MEERIINIIINKSLVIIYMENVAQNLQTQVEEMNDRHLKSQIKHKIRFLFFETEAAVKRARTLKSMQQEIPYNPNPIHILQVIKDNLEGTWIKNYDENVKGNNEIQAIPAHGRGRYKYIEEKMMEEAIAMLNHDNFLKKHAAQTNADLTIIEEAESSLDSNIRIPLLEDRDYETEVEVFVGGRKKSRRRRKKRTKKRRKSRRKKRRRKKRTKRRR
tara:strand:+ start:566 stop:1213 length:648 start_codon:yes stop_codon:yes gene_type:complete